MENKTIATIKFTPIQGSNKSRVDLHMPIQITTKEDGTIHINIPLLGNLRTIAKSKEDIQVALREASEGFFHAASIFGKGIKDELNELGWSGTKNSVRFKLSDRDRRPIFQQVFKASDSKKISVEI